MKNWKYQHVICGSIALLLIITFLAVADTTTEPHFSTFMCQFGDC